MSISNENIRYFLPIAYLSWHAFFLTKMGSNRYTFFLLPISYFKYLHVHLMTISWYIHSWLIWVRHLRPSRYLFLDFLKNNFSIFIWIFLSRKQIILIFFFVFSKKYHKRKSSEKKSEFLRWTQLLLCKHWFLLLTKEIKTNAVQINKCFRLFDYLRLN